ncbi:MAG: hypothetical protein ABIQ61_05700 [Ornithinibacter sp.]
MSTGMSGAPEGEPLLPSLRDQPRLAHHLRESLKILRDAAEDEALRNRIQATLDGRGDLRALVRSPEFRSMADARIDDAARQWQEIPAEERRAETERAISEAGTAPATGNDDAGGPASAGTW